MKNKYTVVVFIIIIFSYFENENLNNKIVKDSFKILIIMFNLCGYIYK